LTLFSFKEKKTQGEGKRKEKSWRCWKSDRASGAASAGGRAPAAARPNARAGTSVSDSKDAYTENVLHFVLRAHVPT